MTNNPPPAASPFPTDSHLATAAKSISAADKKLLASVNAELGRLSDLALNFQPVRDGQRHPINEKIHQAEVALAENPSEELALALHNLIVRRDHADLSVRNIGNAIAIKTRATIDRLIPIALRIIDDAEKAFLAEAEAHRAATKTQTIFADQRADFEARLEASKAVFDEKRRWVREENASAHFLFLEIGIAV